MSGTPAATIATALRSLGSDTLFGLPGGGPNLDVIGACVAQDMRFVLAHTETAACIMASTYGHLTGRTSAAVVTRGPGAASAVNGAAQATLDRQPLILITDTVSSAVAERVAHQRISQRAMLAPVCKSSSALHDGTTMGEVDALITLAGRAPAGAVHLDYDASARATGAVDLPPMVSSRDDSGRGARQRAFSERIAEAQLPVVIVGLEAVPHADRLRPALEAYGAPVLSTYQATGVVPFDHDLAAGLFTNGACESDLLEAADLILLIGVDPVEPIPTAWNYRAPVLSIDAAERTDRYFPTRTTLVGDIGALAEAALTGGSVTWGPDTGRLFAAATEAALREGGSTGFGPLEAVDAMVEVLPTNLTTTVDAGAHFLAIMPLWPTAEPNRLLISNGLATMGYSLPAAIGAGLARPGEPVLCLVGDGGLGMTLAELETIARLQLPVTVVVFNDSGLSLIEIKQRSGHGGASAVSYNPTDFAAVATGMGLPGSIATSGTELKTQLGSGVDWFRPRLIDARIDPTPYRHLLKVTRG